MTADEAMSLGDLPALADLADLQEWSANLSEVSRRLFDRGIRLMRSADGGVFVLGGADLRALAGNPAVGNASADFLMSRAEQRFRRAARDGCPIDQRAQAHFLETQVFTANPPEHTVARRRLARPLMPKAVLAFEGRALQVCEELVGEHADGVVFDFGRDFAAQFVGRFWTQQLGIPVRHAARIQALMEEMNLLFVFDPSADEVRRAQDGTAEYMSTVETAVGSAWRAGPNEFLRQLADGMDVDEINAAPVEFGSYVAANFFDAFHTVGVALTNAVFELFSRPEQVQAVRDTPQLAANALSEGIRLAPPLMLSTRMALEDFEHAGLTIPVGTPIHMVWITGNYDPAVFELPDTFDVNRPRGTSATFGGGIHLCPGRNAAQLLCQIALSVLTRPNVDLRLVDDEHDWVEGSGMRQLRCLKTTLCVGSR